MKNQRFHDHGTHVDLIKSEMLDTSGKRSRCRSIFIPILIAVSLQWHKMLPVHWCTAFVSMNLGFRGSAQRFLQRTRVFPGIVIGFYI